MSSSTSYPRRAPGSRFKADTSLMIDKGGCITCRVRQKKCTRIKPGDSDCGDCMRLNIQCLGVQHNRPDWLRNPEALKETKYRIKCHLTEYAVPRGRGPAPERPYLDFQDLIDQYSPRILGSEASSPLPPHPGQLYRMEAESPTYSQAGAYMNQPDMTYHETPYVPRFEYGGDMMHAPRTTPYRHHDSQSLFLGNPETAQFGYDFQDYDVSPSARRQH